MFTYKSYKSHEFQTFWMLKCPIMYAVSSFRTFNFILTKPLTIAEVYNHGHSEKKKIFIVICYQRHDHHVLKFLISRKLEKLLQLLLFFQHVLRCWNIIHWTFSQQIWGHFISFHLTVSCILNNGGIAKAKAKATLYCSETPWTQHITSWRHRRLMKNNVQFLLT
jgi:hypothetical protein